MPDSATLAAILDRIDLSADCLPREREWIVRAVLAGGDAAEGDVQAYMLDAYGYGPTSEPSGPLTADEFGVLVDKFRAATGSLPVSERTQIRDAFLQGAGPVRRVDAAGDRDGDTARRRGTGAGR
jgi:hypothetical protein